MATVATSGTTFIVVYCYNEECTLNRANMLVERATMQVLWTDFRMVDGEPAWPSHWINRKGEQVLPKVTA